MTPQRPGETVAQIERRLQLGRLYRATLTVETARIRLREARTILDRVRATARLEAAELRLAQVKAATPTDGPRGWARRRALYGPSGHRPGRHAQQQARAREEA